MERILQCIGSLGFGGSQTFIMEVYRKIDKSKYQFDFVVFPENVNGFYEEVDKLGGKVYVCPRYNGKNHFKFIEWWRNFFCEHPEYRVVHGHVRSVALLYLSIAAKRGCQTIVHSHSTSNGAGLSSLVKMLLQYPLRYTVDYLASCSEKAGLWLYGKRAIQKENYIMIPNCIDCRRFSYKEEVRYEIRKQLGFSNDDFVIGHIGRFYEPKNHPFLLEVFRKVKEKNNHAKLVLVGDGEGRGAAEYVVDKYNLRSSVLFLGIQQKPELFYQAMDLFLFPSLWEGLPLTVVEAQAAGLPCVISDTITKDVHLTNLIQAVPLAKSADEWADIIVNVQVNTCRDLNAENKVKLSRFDSIEVVRTLEAFYGRIVENFNN